MNHGYRHPEDPATTWSGKGDKPLWVEALESLGKSIDELVVEIKKPATKTKSARRPEKATTATTA